MKTIRNRAIKFVVIGFVVCYGLVLLVKGCDTSITVNKNAVIIPGECVMINYDATVKDWDEAKAAWLKALKDHPAKN